MPQSDLDYLWDKRDALLYRVELSALYHQKRERFFEAADKGGKAIAILGGSAALGKVLSPDVVMWAAAAITISSTLSLVFGFSDKARRHAELVRNFKQVESDLLRKGERDFCEQDLTDCAARIAMLEASEPPSLATLVRICQNELACARGAAESCKRVGLMPRLLAHFFDMPLSA